MQPPWCGLQSWHCGSYRRAKRENWILNGSYVEDSKKWLIKSHSVFNYFFAALGFVWDNVLEVSFNGICVTRAVHAGNAVVCAASTLFFQLLLHLSVALLSCVIGMLLFFFLIHEIIEHFYKSRYNYLHLCFCYTGDSSYMCSRITFPIRLAVTGQFVLLSGWRKLLYC